MWDGLGVEFEAKYIFDFRGAPGGGSGVRVGRGDTPPLELRVFEISKIWS